MSRKIARGGASSLVNVTMILVQMLLPRFLVLEVLLSLHLLHRSFACLPDFERRDDRNDSSPSAPDPDPERVTFDRAPPPPQPANPNCSIDLDHAAPRHLPLFVSRATGEFLLPSPEKSDSGGGRDVRRILSLDGGNGDIVALCPGAKLKPTDAVSSPVQCLQSMTKKFRVGSGDGAMDFKDIACSKSIKEVIKKSEGDGCGPEDDRGEMLHIGWQDDDAFHPQVSLSKSWLKKDPVRSGGKR